MDRGGRDINTVLSTWTRFGGSHPDARRLRHIRSVHRARRRNLLQGRLAAAGHAPVPAPPTIVPGDGGAGFVRHPRRRHVRQWRMAATGYRAVWSSATTPLPPAGGCATPDPLRRSSEAARASTADGCRPGYRRHRLQSPEAARRRPVRRHRRRRLLQWRLAASRELSSDTVSGVSPRRSRRPGRRR